MQEGEKNVSAHIILSVVCGFNGIFLNFSFLAFMWKLPDIGVYTGVDNRNSN